MSGIFGSSQWMYNSGADFYNGVATQSLRFDDGSSAYLSRTPSSAGNRKTWTWSGWVKRASILGTSQRIFMASSGSDYTSLYFHTSETLYFLDNQTTTKCAKQTNAVFRDVGAWYHILIAIDTTQTTASDRYKLYINGEQVTSFNTNTDYPLNQDTVINNNSQHDIGRLNSNIQFFDGYMAEVNFVDGTALDPTSFGETKNGVWIAKRYTGSYGTNGFRLQFNQTGTGTASSSTIGADTSGNDNHWTSSGIVASDCDMPDSPENNFCTLSSIQNQTSATLSEGNLKAVGTSANWDNLQSTFAVTSGKWYWEVKATSVSETNSFVAGIHETGFPAQSLFWFSGSYTTSAYGTAFGVLDPDNKVTNGSATAFTLGLATNDIIQFRLNLDDNELSVSIDGSDKGKIYDITANIEYTPALCLYNTSSATMNFGQDSTFAGTETAGGNADENGNGDFAYAPPSGYLALCTSNLPEPTISPNADTQADDYFNTVLHTADGTAGSFTGVGFQPDFVWAKSRNNAFGHELWDVVRGVNSTLFSQNDEKEDTTSNRLVSFDSDGFSYGTAGNIYFSSNNSVAWNWKAGGTAVSNTDGTITSSVSANTDAGFSIVSYTGTGGTATVGHGLGVKPSMLIVKPRVTANDWIVYFETLGAGKFITLNNADAESSNTTMFNNTEPTTTVFSINTPAGTFLNKSGEPYVCYAFNSVEGYSKFGSYTGNSSTDGTFVYTGFRPAWVMVKYYTGSGANHWWIWDSVRNTFNVVDEALVANLNVSTQSPLDVDFVSNGFKFRTSNSEMNGSSASYIYMAFAENPFKYANAR